MNKSSTFKAETKSNSVICRLIDLVTKNDKPFVNEGKIIRDLALLTKEIQSTMAEFNNNPDVKKMSKQTVSWLPSIDKPDPWFRREDRELVPHQYTYIRRNHLLVNPKAYSNEVDSYIENLDMNFYESGAYNESQYDREVEQIYEEFNGFLSELSAEIEPLEKEYANKLVYLMSVDKARFRNPVIPDCKLELNIEAIRSHGRVWKYKGIAKVDGKKMADAEWSATIVDRTN